jgi:hypothetical protein
MGVSDYDVIYVTSKRYVHHDVCSTGKALYSTVSSELAEKAIVDALVRHSEDMSDFN